MDHTDQEGSSTCDGPTISTAFDRSSIFRHSPKCISSASLPEPSVRKKSLRIVAKKPRRRRNLRLARSYGDKQPAYCRRYYTATFISFTTPRLALIICDQISSAFGGLVRMSPVEFKSGDRLQLRLPHYLLCLRNFKAAATCYPELTKNDTLQRANCSLHQLYTQDFGEVFLLHQGDERSSQSEELESHVQYLCEGLSPQKALQDCVGFIPSRLPIPENLEHLAGVVHRTI